MKACASHQGPDPCLQQDRLHDLEASAEQHRVQALHTKDQLDRLTQHNRSLNKDLQVCKLTQDDSQAELATHKAQQEILVKEKAKAEDINQMFREANERLQVEKRDLLTMNNALQTELHNVRSLVSSTSSENGASQGRDYVMVQRSTVAGDNTVVKVAALEDCVAASTPATKLETFTAEGGRLTGERESRQRREKQEQTLQALLLQLQEERSKKAELTAANRTLTTKVTNL